VVEREEDGLLRSGAVEMSLGGAEARWKAWPQYRGDLSRHYSEVGFF
jgi:hypothetical protein